MSFDRIKGFKEEMENEQEPLSRPRSVRPCMHAPPSLARRSRVPVCLTTLAALAACGSDGPSRLAEVTVPSEASSFGYRTVEIPGGTYTFGNDDGMLHGENLDVHAAWPRHQVQISSFRIGMTEVTAEQYAAVMGTPHAACKYAEAAPEGEQPVCLSWDEAVQFANAASEKEGLTPCYTYKRPATECVATTKGQLMAAGVEAHTAALLDRDGTCTEWREVGGQSEWSDRSCTGYRLPTDYEWSVAAMAVVADGAERPAAVDVHTIGWTKDDDASGGHAHPVARLAPNAFGLFDTVGNMYEWTFATSATPFRQPQPNPAQDQGRPAGRILRGGSFGWKAVGVESRYLMTAHEAWAEFGLRLARSVDTEVMARTYVAPSPAARLQGVPRVEFYDDPLEHVTLPVQRVEVAGGTLQVSVDAYLPRVLKTATRADVVNGAVAAYLKGRTFDELDSWEGKLQAEHDLRAVIAAAVPSSYGVSDVHFVTYVLEGKRTEPWWKRPHEERHVFVPSELPPGVPEGPPLQPGAEAPTVEALEAAVLDLNGPPVGPGPADEAAIIATFKKNEERIRACYTSGLATRPELQGRITLKVSIKDGTTSEVKVKTTTLDSPTVEACITDAVKGFQWQVNSPFVMLTYPLGFSPS